jgi:iron(III) transport system ATP-binding protein
MIEFDHIQVKFGDFVAIKDLSLEINEGEFFTFLGPSGCGKTTTLRSLVGFINPSAGNIYMQDENITNKPIEKRGIGMVFQSYALFPTMTVRENIEFGLRENKWEKDRIKNKIQEVTNLVNLNEDQLDKNVSELSGGQQQRVAIARALALEPDVICLDEPLSNLDAKLRNFLRSELKNIQKKSGTTMIYVTHDQEEALALSDRIAVFSEGEIQQIGTPLEIYNNPKNSFVATFIGDRFKVNDGFQEVVEAHNPLVDVNPNKEYYIKTEGIRLKTEADVREEDVIIIPAKLVSEEFLGTTMRREYDVNGTIVPSVMFTLDTETIEDTNVEILFRRRDLLSFEKGE